MASLHIIVSLLIFLKAATALNPLNALAGVNMIFPEKVLSNLPSKLSDKIKKYDEDDDRITSSYTFPREYKTTLYKDQYKQTTLVNVYPKVETTVLSPLYFDPGYQTLETSTTQIYEVLNATVAYQTTPMLNSTLKYPNTAPMQSIGYATPEYQHEIHVYHTRINITEMISTTLVNFTVVDHVENNVPFL